MSSDPLAQAFFDEALELLSDFEAGLLRLEESPDDSELLNRIFRSAHTLKGNSSMLGLEAIARFTHALEDLLDQLRKGLRVVTPSVVDVLLASGDVLKGLVARAQGGTGSAAPEAAAAEARTLETIRALLAGQGREEPPAPEPRAPRPVPAVQTLWEIEFRPPADLLRRGLDPEVILDDLGRLGEVAQVTALTDRLPALAELDPETCYLGWRIWLVSRRAQADIEGCFDFVGDPTAVRLSGLPMEEAPAPDETEAAAEPAPPVMIHTDTYSGPDRRGAPGAGAAAAAAEAASIRVPVEKVDRLINLMGELVITQSMVAQTVSAFTPDKLGALAAAVAQMDRHARELHERMMAIRMIPIRTLFARFPRLVRDLAGAAGKQVALTTSGEETELDKTVIERIGDPLTHLVRNAVDHGIEAPAARREAGKPEVGTVRLNAYQQGGSIYIEVGDDGKGLDRDRIVAKAVQNGLVAADQALTDEEAFALVFRPGLSTAEKITEVSGRGVGMDVVKRNVEALGGTITIHSARGQGTTFKVKLPLTLAILDGQSLQVGQQTYIVPLVSIIESVRPRPDTVHRVLAGGEAVTVRGQVLPILRLHRLFGVETRVHDPVEGLVVIVEHEGAKAALLVDELLGQQQVVIKSLETNFRKTEGVAGATILGDGRVALILDVPGLIALARGVGLGAAA
jgi:two-component system chemotaxis sensor kinase CheA